VVCGVGGGRGPTCSMLCRQGQAWEAV
jgi:hypothetical protein